MLLADSQTELQNIYQSIDHATEFLSPNLKSVLKNQVASVAKAVRSECCWWAAAHEVNPLG